MSAFDPRYGEAIFLTPRITRITANNPGPFTGAGTNTYLVGRERMMVVDPGPADEAHIDAIMGALRGRPVSHILITHTHRDHVDGLPLLRQRVDAPTVAEGPHREARPLKDGEVNPFLYAADMDFRPDIVIGDGARIDNGDGVVEAIATPGHTANHMAFTVDGDCLTGDHVMGWSTTVVAPPDGEMGAYLRSLEKMLEVEHRLYFPGHGYAVDEPHRAVSAMRAHRLMRERAILERVRMGDRDIAAMVDALYVGIDTRLKKAAGLSVQAHLEKLADEGRVIAKGLGADTTWSLAA
ncbi:MAG: MBL fold metallo-hydrolase [Pseudomonadota bacterium]